MASPIGISATSSPRFNSLSPPPLCSLHSVSSSHPFHSHLFSHHPEAAKFSFNLSLKNKSLSRASSAEQGIPNELAEDSKFVPLNADDPVFGPPALLLLGFEVEEAAKMQQLLQEMGGEFLQLVFCTEDMISRSLWEAINTAQPNLEAVKVAKSMPRICFRRGEDDVHRCFPRNRQDLKQLCLQHLFPTVLTNQFTNWLKKSWGIMK